MTKNSFFALRIALVPALLAAATIVEARHFVPSFRLLTCVLIFLLLVDLVSLVRGKRRDFLLVLASLAFGICVIEAMASIMEPKEPTSRRDWTVRQPVIGWGPAGAGRFNEAKVDPNTGHTIYNTDYTIDSNLLRQTESNEYGSTIVFFGCSFTFGDGVSDAETLPQLFSDVLDRKQRVLNAAFTGHGPQQFLRELETGRLDNAIGLRPKLFVFLTFAWHAERTACKPNWSRHAPRYAIEDRKVVFKGNCNEGTSLLLREWAENSAAYRWLIKPLNQKISRDDVELYIRIAVAAVKLAKDKYGVPTLIPFIRVPVEYLRPTGFTDDEIIRRLQEGGALVLDVSLAQEEANGTGISIPGDGHPTPYANRLRARLIKNYIEEHLPEVLLSMLD